MTRFQIFLFAAPRKICRAVKIIARKIKCFAEDSAAFKRRYSEKFFAKFCNFLNNHDAVSGKDFAFAEFKFGLPSTFFADSAEVVGCI